MMSRILLWLMALCAVPTSLSADVVIEVRDTAMTAGGEGFVDVWLTTDTDVLISGFDFEFEITPVGTNKGTLTFHATPDTSYVNDSDYLLGNTGNLVLTPSGLSLTGSDLGLTDASLTVASGGALLARLHVLHELPSGVTAADALTDQFTVAAVLAGVAILDDQTTAINIATSQSGTITMLASVPEPGMTLAIVMTAVVLIQRRRHLRNPERPVKAGNPE